MNQSLTSAASVHASPVSIIDIVEPNAGVAWVIARLHRQAYPQIERAVVGIRGRWSMLIRRCCVHARRRPRVSCAPTFVLTSHVMSELEELADDIAFLVDGRIRFAGSIHDLKKATRQLSLERAVAHVLEGGAAA